jgi:hypothetical protein
MADPISTTLIVASLAAAAGAGAGALLAPKTAIPKATPVPTRNVAAAAAANDGLYRRRRGAAANELTGGGAEAPSPGGKTLLGQ